MTYQDFPWTVHTPPSKNGGEAVAYQGRKSCKTTNALFIVDNQGVPLTMSTPQEGNHHDLYGINVLFDELCDMLKEAGISLDGLFLNADGGRFAVSIRFQRIKGSLL